MKTIILCLVFAMIPVMTAFSAPSQNSDLLPMNIREETNAQMYRYGRELYRKGNYREAAQVFEQILKIDCKNKLAQYHLQKISAQGKQFKDVTKFLNDLPCPTYNFSNEDFLPSSLYYEKDPELILEQLALYNKRYRDTRSELTGQISQYKNMIAELEEKTKALAASLDSAQKDASDAALWKERLKESMTLSERLSQESIQLKTQLDATKKAYDKESRALQAQIATAATPAQRNNTQQDLSQKELEITEKSEELSSLQNKFTEIQNRLHQIETSLTNKNEKIKGITKDLSTINYKNDSTPVLEQPASPANHDDSAKSEPKIEKNLSTINYKNDAAPVLKEPTSPTNRDDNAKSKPKDEMNQYKNMITRLEERTKALAASLNAPQPPQRKEVKTLADILSKEATELETQLDTTKKTYDKASEDIHAQITAAVASPQENGTQRALSQKELEITEKSKELSTLQNKLTEIQGRLRQIKTPPAKKRNRAKETKKNLPTT